MRISQLSMCEIDVALSLIWRVFSASCAEYATQEGIEAFKTFLDDKAAMASLRFYGAYQSNDLLGVIALSEGSHIALLFVSYGFQRQGVATSLVDFIRTQAKTEKMTVNSAPNAVEFYRKKGFVSVNHARTLSGITFVPMCYFKIEKHLQFD